MEAFQSYRSSAVAMAAGLFLTFSQTTLSTSQATSSPVAEDDRAQNEILPKSSSAEPSSWLDLSILPSMADSSLEGDRPVQTGETNGEWEPGGTGDGTKVQPAIESTTKTKRPDFNRDIFFANNLELSQEVGWLPINIPCPFNFLMGDPFVQYPLKYTLVPFILSFRWQIDNLEGPWFVRGNWELDTSGAAVAIPRGAETRYFAWIMGMRRNFVPHYWRVTPYWDWRVGLGTTNAKGPLGVAYAQGENFTFTLNMGSGVRYNFGSRYALAAGINWMHISNANLSQGAQAHTGIRNVGINVYGPIIGIDYQLRKRRRQAE
jgi:hypothetical protein